MNDNSEHQQAQTPDEKASNDCVLSVEDILNVLNKAADGANELNEQLEDVFTLPDASATLRLR